MSDHNTYTTLTAFFEGKMSAERYGEDYNQHNSYRDNPYLDDSLKLSFIKGAIHSLRVQEGYKDSINV